MSGAKFGQPNFGLRPTVFSLAAPVAVTTMVLAACADVGVTADSHDGRPVVMTTFTVLADIAQNVGGDVVVVESITRQGVEIHGYDPTPSDVRRVADADLILKNGLGLEAWFEEFIEHIDAPHALVTDGVETMPIRTGDDAGAANPHAWMSPLNVVTYAENIASAFAELDPDNAELFEANAAAYAAELRAVHRELVDAVSEVPEPRRALVTCEGAFSYLARDAGLAEIYLWPVNSDVLGTPQHVVEAIGYVRANDVPAVFCESTVSDKLQRQVAREGSAELAGVLYVDSLSRPDGPVPTYLDLIRYDVRTIMDGLSGAGEHA